MLHLRVGTAQVALAQRRMHQDVLVLHLLRRELFAMPVLGLHNAEGHPDHTPAIVERQPESAAMECPIVIDARGGHARKHGDQARRGLRAGQPLVVAQIRAAYRRHLPIRPGLLRGPFNRVVAVLALIAERLPLPARFEPAADILRNRHIAALGDLDHAGVHAIALRPVRRARHRHRKFPRAVGPINVRVKNHAVAHPHRNMAVHPDLLLGEDRNGAQKKYELHWSIRSTAVKVKMAQAGGSMCVSPCAWKRRE
jgi:hypothetical protein